MSFLGSTLGWALTKESNYSVLLIEAGGRFNLLSKIPIASITLQGNANVDWKFRTVPQKFSSKGFINRQQKWPRGKGLGGSAQINYMLHYGGIRRDFDELEAHGGKTWAFNELKELLSMPLDYDNEQYCERINGQNGCKVKTQIRKYFKSPFERISITRIDPNKSLLTKAFLESAHEMSEPVRFKASEYHTKNGYRHSTYHMYLKPAFHHTNLYILAETQVLKVLFNGKEAVGVQVARDYDSSFEIKAKKEIILSAGAIQSPQLLKLSGVGPKDELKAVNIEPIAFNNHIGTNLYDHFNMPLFVSINTSATVNLKKLLSMNAIFEYIRNGTGIYSNMAIIGQGSSMNGDYGTLVFAMGSADENALRDVSNLDSETFKKFFPLHYNHSEEGFVILSMCHKPKSRGSVRLSGNSVYDEPLIDPRYLEDEKDVRCMLNAIQLSYNVVRSNPLQKLGAKIHWPLISECLIDNEELSQDQLPSKQYLVCVLEYGALTAHHPVSIIIY